MRNQEYWINCYKRQKAFWVHGGNPNQPHALLTSGKHSSGFFNSRLVIPDEDLMGQAAFDLVELLDKEVEGKDLEIDIIVGPQTGATKLAELISYMLQIDPKKDCTWASPAKNENGGKKSMVFNDEDLGKVKGRFVLLCEDVLTTGGSIDLTVDATTLAGGIILPFVLVLVNRSGLKEVKGKKIIALIDHPMPTWDGDECPLCKGGSEAIRAKGDENWALLNQEY